MRAIKTGIYILMVFQCVMMSAQVQIGKDIKGKKTKHFFGHDVALSADGQRMAIGISTTTDKNGSIKIYENRKGKWKTIGAFEGNKMDGTFGRAIDLTEDGKRTVLTYFNRDENSGNVSVRIIEENDKKWKQVGQEIVLDKYEDLKELSASLAGNGSRVIVCTKRIKWREYSYWEFRTYDLQDGSWIQMGDMMVDKTMVSTGLPKVDFSADGKRVIIRDKDRVKVYEEKEGHWIQIGKTFYSETEKNEFELMDVSISKDGKVIAVSSHNNSMVKTESGIVSIYEEQQGRWLKKGNSIYGTRFLEHFGVKISLDYSGDLVVIGNSLNTEERFSEVAIFRYDGSDWRQIGNRIKGDELYDGTGRGIDISSDGKTLVKSAIHFSRRKKSKGQVKVYDISNLSFK